MSNLVQSGTLSPVPMSANLLRSRLCLSSESASPPSGASGGEGAGASSSPIRWTPLGSLSCGSSPVEAGCEEDPPLELG